MSGQITRKAMRRGIELGFFRGEPLIYGGTEPVAIDAQAGKGKFTRFLGVNLVTPRTAHMTKIITDPKDAELAWTAWKTLERQGYRVRFFNPDKLYGYPSESYNINTPVIETARRPELRGIVDSVAYDCARFLIPIKPDSKNEWVGQGACSLLAFYNATTALFPSLGWPCTVGGAWDFFGRSREDVALDLFAWARHPSMELSAGMARLLASLAESTDQWNAYASVFLERLQPYGHGAAARTATDTNSFDPAEMKCEKTALFIIGSARSKSSRDFVGSMTAAVIERFADAHGTHRALVVGEEWGQLYVSNFYEILIRAATGGENALLEARDEGYFTVDVPEFWERPEMAGMLRDVREKPDKYAWLDLAGPCASVPAPPATIDGDTNIEAILSPLRSSS